MLPLVWRKRRKESGWEREVVKRHRRAEGRRRTPDRTRREQRTSATPTRGDGGGRDGGRRRAREGRPAVRSESGRKGRVVSTRSARVVPPARTRHHSLSRARARETQNEFHAPFCSFFLTFCTKSSYTACRKLCSIFSILYFYTINVLAPCTRYVSVLKEEYVKTNES